MSCPYDHDEANDCCELCAECEQEMCIDKDDHEIWQDSFYCYDCIPDIVKRDSETMTLDELCEALDYPDQLYEWIYGEDVDNAVETIGNWWFTQRKKMFRKPVKSAQKK